MPSESRCKIITMEDRTALVAGVTEGTSYKMGGFIELLLFARVSAVTGTDPTLDIKVQFSPDNINWIDAGQNFTQFDDTVGAIQFLRITSPFGEYVRVHITISAGDTYTFKVWGVGKTSGG